MARQVTTIDLTLSDNETPLPRSKPRDVVNLTNDLDLSSNHEIPPERTGANRRPNFVRRADRPGTRGPLPGLETRRRPSTSTVPGSNEASRGKRFRGSPLSRQSNAARGFPSGSNASNNHKRHESFLEIADSEDERRSTARGYAWDASQREVLHYPNGCRRSKPRSGAGVEVEPEDKFPTPEALLSQASGQESSQAASHPTSTEKNKKQLQDDSIHVSQKTPTKTLIKMPESAKSHPPTGNGGNASPEVLRSLPNDQLPDASPLNMPLSTGLESPLLIALPCLAARQRKEDQNSSDALPDISLQSAAEERAVGLKLRPESVKTWLKQFSAKQSYETSHGCFVTIRNARLTSHDPVAAFTSAKSPFADLDNDIKDKHTVVAKNSENVINYTYKKKLNRSYKKVPVTPVQGSTSRVPGYTHHTSLKTSILEGDDGKLKYFPHFGGLDDANENKSKRAAEKLDQDLRDAFESIEVFSSSSSLDSENDLRDRFYLTALLRHFGIELQALSVYVAERDKKVLQEEYYLSNRMIKTLFESLKGDPAPPSLENDRDLASIYEAWESFFSSPLRNVIFTKERLKDLTRSTEISHQEESSQVIGTYTDICCVICNTIHCQIHGWYAEGRSSETDEEDLDIEGHKKPKYHFRQHIVRLLEETLQSYARRNYSNLDINEDSLPDPSPCSEGCYLVNKHAGEIFLWSSEEEDLLKAITVSRFSQRDQKQRSCYLSFALKRPCWQVQQQILTLGTKVRLPKPQTLIGTGINWQDNRKWYDNKAKVLHDKWREWTQAHNHQARAHMEPCIHSGPCQKGCPCFEANLLCEANCLCSDECQRTFTGCSCHSKGLNCASEICICIQMNRECGAECSSCGAVERLDPANKYNEGLFLHGCQNVALQRAVAKRLFVGESKIKGAGYGLFIGETAKKGDFIGEYVGEDITWSEVARRGIYNGLKDTSYLFDINGDGAIDGDRLANKTRYINHADNGDPARNCDARVMWVGGVHRIKFNAARPITEGEELLFDYGEEFVTKAGLDKNRPIPNSKKSRTRKILEDVAGAEKALDDMAQKTGEDRNSRTVIRGALGGVGGRSKKPRKLQKLSSPPPIPSRQKSVFTFEVQDDEEMDPDFVAENVADEAEEESDEAEEEKENERNSRKRQRRLPSRYTR
ncbi:hypothetical protein BP5796_06686 [Coleophoma crateriformis]|uniref:SET domain-containing protein n=1 Tax=Coleophoma crateriformis TaxID=565419 RepID=A0A3D8RPD0_9HELO|nr:hypothetical protein BP5796_06686 [Coleophoma crateriformis]